ESLRELKSQFTEQEPHYLEERLEKRLAQLDAIFIDNKNTVYRDGLYEEARAFLERAKKELNPTARLAS
ncbi:MAG TPA: hypothetical protein VIJ46_02125, partial [Rhabdochlamydiaceae bacterium]